MDRRRFLTLVGSGALGGAAGAVVAAKAAEEPLGPEPLPLDGKVAIPSSGLQRIVWSVDTDSKAVALTFDDGPDPQFTPRILDLLDRRGIKATFFAMGYNAAAHPSLLREVAAAGHEIGSHSWSHLSLTRADTDATRKDIEQGNRAIEDILQKEVRLFRPPYGRFDEVTVRFMAEKRQDMVMWSLTRGEVRWMDPRRVRAHVAEGMGPGGILGLHDGIGQSTFQPRTARADELRGRRQIELDVLPKMLDDMESRGLRPVTITELIAKERAELRA